MKKPVFVAKSQRSKPSTMTTQDPNFQTKEERKQIREKAKENTKFLVMDAIRKRDQIQ